MLGQTQMPKTGAPNRVASDIDTVHELASFVNSVANRCSALADAVAGPVPTEAANGLEAIDPSGIIPGMGAAASRARRRLQEAMDALTRIETAVGIH